MRNNLKEEKVNNCNECIDKDCDKCERTAPCEVCGEEMRLRSTQKYGASEATDGIVCKNCIDDFDSIELLEFLGFRTAWDLFSYLEDKR